MQRQSIKEALRNQYQQRVPLQEIEWIQPPWTKGDILPNQRQEVVRQNLDWYKINHPDWLKKFNQQQNNEAQTNRFSSLDAFSQQLPQQTQKQVSRASQPPQFENQRLSGTNIRSSTDRTSILYTRPTLSTQTKYQEASSIQELERYQDFLKLQCQGADPRQLFLDSREYRHHQLKISLSTALYVSSAILAVYAGSRLYFGEMKFQRFGWLGLYSLLQILSPFVIQKNKSFALNIVLVFAIIFTQNSIFSWIIQHPITIDGHTLFRFQHWLQYYVMMGLAILVSLQNLFMNQHHKQPNLNKMQQFQQSSWQIVKYSIFSWISPTKIFVRLSNYSIRNLLYTTLLMLAIYYLSDFIEHYNLHWAVIRFIAFYIVVVKTTRRIQNKLHQYRYINHLSKNYKLSPLYIIPLLIHDKDLEIESLKYLFAELEQSKKILKDGSTSRYENNKNSNQLTQILITYLQEKYLNEMETLKSKVTESQRIQDDQKRLYRTSLLTDFFVYWKLFKNSITNLLQQREIRKQLQFLEFLSEIVYRVLSQNKCGLSKADLQHRSQTINEKSLTYLQSAGKVLSGDKHFLRLRKIICYSAINLTQQEHLQELKKRFNSLLWGVS